MHNHTLVFWLRRVHADLDAALTSAKDELPKPEPRRYRQWNNTVLALASFGVAPTDDDPADTWHWAEEEGRFHPALDDLESAILAFSEEIEALAQALTPPTATSH